MSETIRADDEADEIQAAIVSLAVEFANKILMLVDKADDQTDDLNDDLNEREDDVLDAMKRLR